jgi:hypothetical protein
MSLRHTSLLPCRIIATSLFFFVAVIASRAGESIRFSKPVVPLASPVKEQAALPEPRSKSIGFEAPDVEPPMIAPPRQQPIVRVERREEKEDGLHPLLRTPKIFADPDEQKLSSDPTKHDLTKNPNLPLSAFPRSARASDIFGGTRPESALSPITDPNWDARDSDHKAKDPTKKDRNENRARDPFTAQEDSDSKFDVTRSQSMRDLFTAHVREKPTPLQLERRAAWQQLLNPTADSDAKNLSSLQPVVSATDVKPGSLGIPTVSGNNGLNPHNSDPMTAFNRQHERLRGPVMEDINKKYSPQSQSTAPAKSSLLDPRTPLPLNRQPAMHEFPKRDF